MPLTIPHPIDVAVPEARRAARIREVERRQGDSFLRCGRWFQTTSNTNADGLYTWSGEHYNTDDLLFQRAPVSGRADGGVMVTEPGIYQINGHFLLGSNLTANTRYDVYLSVSGVVKSRELGDTGVTNGYFIAQTNTVLMLAENDIVSVAAADPAKSRYGDANGDWTYLGIVKLA